MKFSMTEQEKIDLLIQVIAWASLTLCILVKPVLRGHIWDKEKVIF
jgi:hypothetical protein